jgi:asparagine synthase (glutamine-hydrolysing)
MAGICGCIGLRGEQADPGLAGPLLAAIRHRGPASSERHFAGPALLIAASGHASPQGPRCSPIGSTGNGVFAIADGIVTNAAELAAELGVDGRSVDGVHAQDLIARAYEKFAEGFAEKIEGSFAIAVWDERARRLVLARDRLGAKPLYHAATGRAFLFGSTIRALLAGGAAAEIRYEAIEDYLTAGSVPGTDSVYREVSQVPPAHLLILENDAAARLERYWDLLDPRWDREHRAALESADRAEALWPLFRESVGRMAPRQGPVGVFLSGGPDAAAVVAALGELGRRDVRTYTACVRGSGYDESATARRTARHFGTSHHEVLVDSPAGDIVRDCVGAFDEPYAHPSAVALYLAARKAQDEVRVVLGGESADDLFAGNRTLQASKMLGWYNRLPRWLHRGVIPWAVGRLPRSYSQMSFSYRAKRFVEAAGLPLEQADALWKQVIRSKDKAALYGPALRELPERPAALRSQPHLDRARDLAPLNRLIYAEMQMSLVDDVLYKHDRVPAAFGLDNFGPYTDRRVVEFAFRLPVDEKIRGPRTKFLLRKMLEKRVPREAAYRRKLPFNAPSSEWLSGSLREFLLDTLSAGTLRRQGVLDPSGVARMIGDHLERRVDHGPALWSLLALTLWLEAAGR